MLPPASKPVCASWRLAVLNGERHRRLRALEQRSVDQAELLLVWVDPGQDVAERLEQVRALYPTRALVPIRWQAPEVSRL